MTPERILNQPLALAVMCGNVGGVAQALSDGADPNYEVGGWDPVDQQEQTSTMLAAAAMRGHAEILQILIDNGADLDAQCEKKGLTAFMWR